MTSTTDSVPYLRAQCSTALYHYNDCHFGKAIVTLDPIVNASHQAPPNLKLEMLLILALANFQIGFYQRAIELAESVSKIEGITDQKTLGQLMKMKEMAKKALEATTDPT